MAGAITMTPELYKEVALRRDVPEHGLKAGDVAMLVELVPGPPASRWELCWKSSTA